MSDRRGNGFQMQGLKSEIGLRARTESPPAIQRPVMRGAGERMKNRIDEVRFDS
jgi:hypothetical protein